MVALLALLVIVPAIDAAACMVEPETIDINIFDVDETHQEACAHGHCHHMVLSVPKVAHTQPHIQSKTAVLGYCLHEVSSPDSDGLMRPPKV